MLNMIVKGQDTMKRFILFILTFVATAIFIFLRVAFFNVGVRENDLQYLSILIVLGSATLLFLLIPKLNLLWLGAQSVTLFLYSLFLFYFIYNHHSLVPGDIYAVNLIFKTVYFYSRDIYDFYAFHNTWLLALSIPYLSLLLLNLLISDVTIPWPKRDHKMLLIILTLIATVWEPLNIYRNDIFPIWIFGISQSYFWVPILIIFVVWIVLTKLDHNHLSKQSKEIIYIAYPIGFVLPIFMLGFLYTGITFSIVDILRFATLLIVIAFGIILERLIKNGQEITTKKVGLLFWVTMLIYYGILFVVSMIGCCGASV